MPRESSVARIRRELAEIVDAFAALIVQLPTEYFDGDAGHFQIIAPKYRWRDPSAQQRAEQLELKRRYDPVSELLRLLLRAAPEDLVAEFERADDNVRTWIELKSNWSLTGDAATNERAFREDAAALDEVLDVLDSVGSGDLLVVPDTNSLIAEPDPTVYRSVAGQTFTFVLLPTVLGELDKLKMHFSNPTVQNKAKAAITRVKGWRSQKGSLVSGVTVDKTITVKVVHREPDMKQTLSWLDAAVPDDRIVASVLELQTHHPAACLLLVTGDVNLLNKAAAALIETDELP